jgi:type IV pilus assembly protein PilW
MHRPSPHKTHAKGFSLVELMVAMAIGLIISLAIFAALNTFEGRKRTSTSVNDIDQAGNYAVYALDKWVRNAGSGFTQNTFQKVTSGGAFDYLLCTLTASKSTAQILPRASDLPAPFTSVSTATSNIFRLVPALIYPDGPHGDSLLVMSGSAGQGESAVPFRAAPTAAALTVYSATGFKANDLILVARKGALSPCLIEQVGNVDTTAPNAQLLNLSGTYYGAATNSVSLESSTFCNTAKDSSPAVRRCNVVNLGNMSTSTGNYANPPSFLVLGVGDNNTLFGYDLLQTQSTTADVAAAPFAVADSVFEMHALYGVDANNDGKVDTWTAATGDFAPATLAAADGSGTTNLCRIKAIRIGLIMRTALEEKDTVSNGTVTLFSDVGLSLTVTVDQNFRYRTIETTIPLRNMLNVPSCPAVSSS